MPKFKLVGGALVAGLFSMTASAQTYEYVVEPVMQPDQVADSNRAQFIRAGDLSPEEYNRLMAEADKIRAYQGTSYNSTDYSDTASVHTDSTPVYSEPMTTYGTVHSYDGRPTVSSTVTTSQGYQIELYDTPIAAPVTQAATTMSSSGHTVVKGDTLYAISKRYGVSLTQLRSQNGLSGNTISIGQVLSVPGRSASYSQPYTINSQPLSSGPRPTLVRNVEPIPFTGVYAVLPGDTLYSISRRACVSVQEVTSVNGLGSTMIAPGQRLTMPAGHCLN